MTLDFSKLDLNDFQKKYEKIMLQKDTRLEYCPNKTSMHLDKINDMDVHYINTMPAKTDNGSFVKSIYVDLESSKNTIEDILYVRDGIPHRCTNIGLTPYRCGIIGALIVRYLGIINDDIKVGFIGTGNINKHIAMEISKWIPNVTNFAIKNRSGNMNGFNDIKPTDYNLSNCDIIFSCTSNLNPNNMMNEDEFDNVRCLVALDGGNIFGPSTRLHREFFSDHIEQIQEVYKNEFPYDKYIPINIHQLDNSLKNYSKVFVNLYGIAYADAVLFEQLLDNE